MTRLIKFRVRFRPQNAIDYPELSMIVEIDEVHLTPKSLIDAIDKSRQEMLAATNYIKKRLPNNDIIGIKRLN